MPDASCPLDEAIDARAPGLAAAELIFVFGTRQPEPARIAADLFSRQLAPLIVVTGGSTRQADGMNEAEHHLQLLLDAGVPAGCVIVESQSSSTLENVLFARPLVERRRPAPRSAIAVVKRHHRRALVTLARHVPSLERIYAVDYDGVPTQRRVDGELRTMRDLYERGIDLLVADGRGWRHSNP